jgi:hypothetical protein
MLGLLSRRTGFALLAAGRVSARLPSNFLLLAQKKVTKEECLNTSHLSSSLRLLAYFSGSGPRTFSELLPRLPRSGSNIRYRYASTLRVIGLASCARASAVRLYPKRGHRMAGVQALCFGDFHLGRQMKVTRLSGRDPTQCHAGQHQA